MDIKINRSYSNIVFDLISPSQNIISKLIKLVMLVMKSLILKLKIFKLFVLRIAIIFKDLCEIIHTFAYLFMQLLEFCLCTLLELLQLHLKLALLFTLSFKRFFEVIDGYLYKLSFTSISSTCSLTVVVKPSFVSPFPESDIIKSFRLELVLINKIITTLISMATIENRRSKQYSPNYQSQSEQELSERIMELYQQIETVTVENIQIAQKNSHLQAQIQTIDHVLSSMTEKEESEGIEEQFGRLLNDHLALAERVAQMESAMQSNQKNRNRDNQTTLQKVTSIHDIMRSSRKKTVEKYRQKGPQSYFRKEEATRRNRYC